MSRVILESKLIEAFNNSFEITYVYGRVVVWDVRNEKQDVDKYLIDGKYYTRQSYSYIGENGFVKMTARQVRTAINWLVKHGYLECISDNYSYKTGNLYRHTDKVFEILTPKEFDIFANTFNADITYTKNSYNKNKSNNTQDYNNTKQTLKNNSVVSRLNNINKI